MIELCPPCVFACVVTVYPKTQLVYSWVFSEHPRLLSETLPMSHVVQLTLGEKPHPLSERTGFSHLTLTALSGVNYTLHLTQACAY
jgi:hypothetical protein